MLGMLGGGQLGRYFVIAARKLGYRVTVLDPDPDSPAACMADRHLIADYEDPKALAEIAATCAAVSTEFENVPAASLAQLASRLRVAPSADCVVIAQDRIREKGFFKESGLPVGPFRSIESRQDFEHASEFPGILKRARFGYDGKGQARVADRAEAVAAWETFGRVPCVLEALVALDLEVSVVLARASDGEVRAFPVAENRHTNGILDMSIAPARVPDALAAEAVRIASALAAKMGYVGTLGVEFFVSGGQLLLNEIAPRPHNSGHYTIDACPGDQFEQQLRALCGLPLADARALSPAVMVNLLGDIWEEGQGEAGAEGLRGRAPDWTLVLGTPGARLHLYGKTDPRIGRKMGHFTVLDASRDAALERALALRSALGIADG